MSAKARYEQALLDAKNKKIKRQDSGSALDGYRKSGYTKPPGINTQNFIDEQETPHISTSRPISNKDIRKTADDIKRLKANKKKSDTGLAPPMGLKRDKTIESPPKKSPPKLRKKETRIRQQQQQRKRYDLTRQLGREAREHVNTAEQRKKEDWRLQQRLQRQQKDLITITAVKAEEAFYNFLKSEWKARYKALGRNDEAFLPGKLGQGTNWKNIKPHYTFRDSPLGVGLDNFIQNHDKYTTDIENLNKTIFKNAGNKGERYYQQLKKWNARFFTEAEGRKKAEGRDEAIQAFGTSTRNLPPPKMRITRTEPGPVSKRTAPKPPPSGNQLNTKPVGQNQIVNHTPKPDKYLTAAGPDYRVSKRQTYNKDTKKYEDFGDIILKIKSTGHVESIQEKQIPNNIKWIDIHPRVYTANTEEKYAYPINPPPKGKFTSTSGYDGIDKYFFNIGSNKCFEYDEGTKTGTAMKNNMNKQGQRLEKRAPHIKNNIWYSNPGDTAIWEQNLRGQSGYPKKGTIWDETPKQGHDGIKYQRKKILEKTVDQIKKNGHNNFIIFSSPHTHYESGFLDLNKKVAMGNGWYMLEFINNLDEMHLREEINKGPMKKNRTPVTFFISEKDIIPPEDPEKWDAWGKERKILCEWEYRMIIIEQLTNNNSLLVDIQKLIDFNTTERYCESGDMMRYNEYTNICGHNSLKAKEKWQEDSLKTLENIKTRDFAEFKKQIEMMFYGLAMNEIIQTILNNGEENRQGIENDIKDEINNITILKFRSGKPNSAVFPMPMKEIENIKNSVIGDIRTRVIDFFETTNNELEKLSEMECLETDKCCEKTITQVNSIMNFTNSKSAAFTKIISELKEYNEHLAPLLHMELLSKKDKEELKKIQQDLLDNKTAIENQWEKTITNDKLKEKILVLITKKTEQIINNRKQVAEDLQWIDLEGRTISDKWDLMKEEDLKWKDNKKCIEKLIETIRNFNEEGFQNQNLQKTLVNFKNKINTINESFGDVLTNYQDQHTNVLTKLQEIGKMSKEQLTAGINTETIILVKEKMEEELEKIKLREEEKRKLKEAKDKEQSDLIKGILKAALNAEEIYQKTADTAGKSIKNKQFAEAMKIIQEGQKQKRKDDEEKAEKERKRVALDKAMIEMVKKWKEKMEEQKRKDDEEDYRNYLMKKYNEAIGNNLKIRKGLEDIIERLNYEEENLMSTQVITPEIHNILFLETCKIDDLIKAYKKDGYLMNIINESITNITDTINKAKNIVNGYSKERLVGYDENINKFIIQITDKLNMLNGWKEHLNDFDIINEIFDIQEDKVIFRDLEAPSATKENIRDMINQLDSALDKNPQKYIEGCLSVLKDKLNGHLRELNDTTQQNTATILEKLKQIEIDAGNAFVHYKELCKTFSGTNFFSDAEKKYDELFKLLADKMKLETTAIIANTKSEQYQMMVENEKKVEEYNNKYNEIMKHIDDNVRSQLPLTLLEDIHEEDSSLFVDEEGTSGLLNRSEAIELIDIEENKEDEINGIKTRLEIDIKAKNNEFLFYKKLLVDMGFKDKEESMEIKAQVVYTNLINSLQNDTLSNYLCIKNLLKLKLLQWKTKAIHKEDGDTELLMKEKAKTLKEGAEQEEKERKAQEKLGALAAIRKQKEEGIKKKRDENAIIIQKYNDIQNKLNDNKKRIESIKEARQQEIERKKKERIALNNNYLRELFRHNRPNLKEVGGEGGGKDYTQQEIWG